MTLTAPQHDLGTELDLLARASSRRLRPAYGFDDVAIVPGVETVHPDDVDLRMRLGHVELSIPFVASAMDGVVDVPFAIALGRLGGLAVLNLEGLQTRYERPAEPLAEIVDRARARRVTELMQRLYQAPIRDELVARRVEEIKRPAFRRGGLDARRRWPPGSGRLPSKPASTSSSSSRRSPRAASAPMARAGRCWTSRAFCADLSRAGRRRQLRRLSPPR